MVAISPCPGDSANMFRMTAPANTRTRNCKHVVLITGELFSNKKTSYEGRSENRKSGTKRTSAPGAPGVECNAGVKSDENSIMDLLIKWANTENFLVLYFLFMFWWTKHHHAKALYWLLAKWPSNQNHRNCSFSLWNWVYAYNVKENVTCTIKKQEVMDYILHSYLFKFNASVDVILRQSHDITAETGKTEN